MDDLIVVILTLIVAAAGALGQLRKKKRPPAPVEDEGELSQPESIWDLFQEETVQQQPVEKQDTNEYDHEKYKEPAVEKVRGKTEKSKYQFAARNEGASSVERKLPMKKATSKMKSSIRKDFSLRKAVIYSEILNRKYS